MKKGEEMKRRLEKARGRPKSSLFTDEFVSLLVHPSHISSSDLVMVPSTSVITIRVSQVQRKIEASS